MISCQNFLAGIHFDDELFVDIDGNILAGGDIQIDAFHLGFVQTKIGDNSSFLDLFHAVVDQLHFPGTFPHSDYVTWFADVGWDVNETTIYMIVAMPDELASCSSGRSQPHTVHYVIQSTFEHLHQGGAGNSFLSFRSLKEVFELPFQQTIHVADFLFFSELNAVFRPFKTAISSMLTGRKRFPLKGTPRGTTAFAFQKQFHALTPADFASRTGISGHEHPP
jgi:hypothetical protein